MTSANSEAAGNGSRTRFERLDLFADMIVDAVGSGETLTSICRTLEVSTGWVYDWIRDEPEFAARMEAARARGYDAIADTCVQIADDTTHDVLETSRGRKANKEFIARSKLRVETRLKLLAKWHPSKYGEKLQVDQRSGPLPPPAFSDDPNEAARQYQEWVKSGAC